MGILVLLVLCKLFGRVIFNTQINSKWSKCIHFLVFVISP